MSRTLAVVLLVGAFAVGCQGPSPSSSSSTTTPSTADQQPEPGTAKVASSSDTTKEYTCPMHPEVRKTGPGQCPKCGMNLVPADQK
jgi:hypothetical protein